MQSVLVEGLSTALVGMVGVFLGLVLLVAVINVMRLAAPGQKAPERAKSEAAEAPEAAPAAAGGEHDPVVVAAIVAAVQAVLGKEGRASGFVVRRIRRF